MARTVKVAYVTHATEMGGAEYNLLDLLRDIDLSYVSPYVISPGNEALSDALRNRKEITFHYHPLASVNLLKKPGNLFSLLNGIRTLSYYIKNEVDVVHVCSYRGALYGLIAGKLAGKPTVWHVHDLHKSRLFRKIMPWFADKLIAVSEAVGKQFSSKAQREKVNVVYNGVDMKNFQLQPEDGSLKKELNLNPHAFLIGAVGRLAPWKRFHYILQALPALIQKHPHTHLAIVGDAVFSSTDYKEELIKLAKQLNIRDHVHFLGNRQDIPNVMRSLDLFINFSEDEPFGRVIIEAMAMETPVIVADSGGAPEIIRNVSCGFIAKSGDTESLLESMVKMTSLSHQQRTAYGINGRKRVIESFDSKQIARNVMNVYRELPVFQQQATGSEQMNL